MSAVPAQRQYRYYEFVMAAFVTILICSNLIGPAKIVQFDWLPFAFGAGVLFFPISYVFGDVLTEVYGYARARRVIWAGFGGLAFAAFMAWVVVALPPAPFWKNQEAYEVAFGTTWRIAALPGDGVDGGVWLIFGDATNGTDTYGGGRYLYTEPVLADGSVVVDFNLAYNPPCVFSPYATCPLPPMENRLSLRIEAGERVYQGHE